MKKGQILQGEVIAFEYPNKGIVQTEEGKVKVALALPGQVVKCSIKKTRHGVGEGILKEVVKRSPIEVAPMCEHFEKCGGCIYQTFPYEEELKIKERQVRNLLEPVLANQSEEYLFEDIVCSPKYNCYRNKMEFTFGDEYKDGPMSLGMHRRGSFYDIETVDKCQIVDADYCKIIDVTLDYFKDKNIPYFHRMSHIGYLRHLLIRRSEKDGSMMVALVTTTQEPWNESSLINGYKEALLSADLSNGKITGILHILNDSVADVVKADSIDLLYGTDFITDELLGLSFKITPFSFFQTNSKGAEVLYSKVREYAASVDGIDGGFIYDLYSGTGTITQLMGKGAKKAIGVEIVEEAVEAAKENAESNGLHNCEFIAGDVLKVLDDLTEKPDMIILDPPRDGIHPKALPKILSYGVDNIIYVSCKVTSLARDLVVFLENGYVVKKVCPVDQFPRTGHVETVCLLSRKP